MMLKNYQIGKKVVGIGIAITLSITSYNLYHFSKYSNPPKEYFTEQKFQDKIRELEKDIIYIYARNRNLTTNKTSLLEIKIQEINYNNTQLELKESDFIRNMQSEINRNKKIIENINYNRNVYSTNLNEKIKKTKENLEISILGVLLSLSSLGLIYLSESKTKKILKKKSKETDLKNYEQQIEQIYEVIKGKIPKKDLIESSLTEKRLFQLREKLRKKEPLQFEMGEKEQLIQLGISQGIIR